MNNTLIKTIVVRFYRINTGFFLVSFILLFGLLNGKATMDLHHHIMSSICSSYSFAAGAAVVWLLYNLKCLSYTTKQLSDPANSFLFALQSLPDRRQIPLWCNIHALLLSPMLVYAGAAVAIGIIEGHIVLPVLFAVFQLLLCGSGYIYFHSINSTWRQPILTLPGSTLKRKKHFFTYLLHYSVTTRKSTFIGIKALSLLLLQGMVAANAYRINKESICVLMMFLVSAHSLLPAYYVRFTEGPISFTRNLPITTSRRYLVFVLTYAVIFLPELLFLLINGNHTLSLQLTFSLYAVAVSQLSLYTAIQYFNKLNTERYTSVIFVFFFASLLLLASFNLWVLFVIEAIAGPVLYILLYPRYEHTV